MVRMLDAHADDIDAAARAEECSAEVEKIDGCVDCDSAEGDTILSTWYEFLLVDVSILRKRKKKTVNEHPAEHRR